MAQIDKDTLGLPTLNQIYHFIKSKFKDDGLGTPTVPDGRVVNESETMDAENSISVDDITTSRRRTMKPHSMHFLSIPVQYEYSPIYQSDGQKFYGHPLPIYDSLANNSKSIPSSTTKFSPNGSINTFAFNPGDVAIQGRYGQAIHLTKHTITDKPQTRITNGSQTRTNSDIKTFMKNRSVDAENEYLIQKSNTDSPVFHDPNIDGSSIYMLSGKTGATNPGIDIDTEALLGQSGTQLKYKDEVLRQTFRPQSVVSNKILISSDSLYFYTKGLNSADKDTHDISMLSSGNVLINSFRNIIITTPKVSSGENIGRIQLGNNKDPDPQKNPLSPMQPLVKGFDYRQTMNEMISTLEMIGRMFEVMADGGLSADSDGQVKATGIKRSAKSTLPKQINSIKKTLEHDLSLKVFTE